MSDTLHKYDTILKENTIPENTDELKIEDHRYIDFKRFNEVYVYLIFIEH